MLVSDRVYNRIPAIWLVMGILFLLLGLLAGPDIQYFFVYPLLGLVCIARSFQVYLHRRSFNHRNRITILTQTQKIERDTLSSSAPSQEQPVA